MSGVTTVSSIVLSMRVDRRGNSNDESGAAFMFEQAKSRVVLHVRYSVVCFALNHRQTGSDSCAVQELDNGELKEGTLTRIRRQQRDNKYIAVGLAGLHVWW